MKVWLLCLANMRTRIQITQSSDDNLKDLIHQLYIPAESTCSVGEYMNGEDDLPTCSERDDDSWKDEFFASLICFGAE